MIRYSAKANYLRADPVGHSVSGAPAGLDYMFRFRNMRYGSPLIQPGSVCVFDVSEEIQKEYEGYLVDREDNVLPNSTFTISVPAEVLTGIRGEANNHLNATSERPRFACLSLAR